MSFYRDLELLDSPLAAFYGESCLWRSSSLPFSSPFLYEQEALDLALDLPFPVSFPLAPPSPLSLFGGAADLIQIGASASLQRFQERVDTEICLRSLSDRVAALELGFDRALRAPSPRDRKYTWTSESGGRKYKIVAEAAANGERNVKFTADFKDKDQISRKYSFQKSSSPAAVVDKKKKEKKVEEKKSTTRLVEISDGTEHGAIVLRQAFSKRAIGKGKKKELSRADAALLIQMTFREHLIRRSLVLRGLRDLAIAKAKLKEIRSLFSNFSYRQRVAKDLEERQRFSEKIIVLLLTVDAIQIMRKMMEQGADYMVRVARRSMVDELEAMLEIVDPQPGEKLRFLRRRKFDLPVNGASKEIALGVAEVVQMLNDGEVVV